MTENTPQERAEEARRRLEEDTLGRTGEDLVVSTEALNLHGGASQFLLDVEKMQREDKRESEIAESYGFSVADLRWLIVVARNQLHAKKAAFNERERRQHEAAVEYGKRDVEQTNVIFKAPEDTPPVIDMSLDDADEYLLKAKRTALHHYNDHMPAGFALSLNDVYIVWFSKVLQNWKALVATNVPGDGVYYEITYNGDQKETYVDCYSKVDNVSVPD